MANAVKFIRVHGRVVPIRAKSGQAKHRPSPVKKPFITKTKAVFLAAAIGVAAYLLARRVRYSGNKRLANLQHAVQEAGGNLGVVTGAPKAQTNANRAFEAILGLKHNVHSMKGGVVLNRGVDAAEHYKPSHTINPLSVLNRMDNKRLNTSMISMRAMPRTLFFEDALEAVKHRGKRLKEIFPQFVVKKDFGAMGTVDKFANEKTITLKKNLFHFANPERYVFQERLNLTNEYRAHMLNGEVFGISYRRITNPKLAALWGRVSKGGGAFLPVVNPFERARIKKLLKQNVSLRSLGKHQSMFAAFDIAKTDKGLKILEGNTAPGTFGLNPLVNRRFKELATGQLGHGKAFAIGGGSAAITYKIAAPKDKRK